MVSSDSQQSGSNYDTSNFSRTNQVAVVTQHSQIEAKPTLDIMQGLEVQPIKKALSSTNATKDWRLVKSRLFNLFRKKLITILTDMKSLNI